VRLQPAGMVVSATTIVELRGTLGVPRVKAVHAIAPKGFLGNAMPHCNPLTHYGAWHTWEDFECVSESRRQCSRALLP
jgi:hypothetical protein